MPVHKWRDPKPIGKYKKPFITGWRILDNMIPPTEFTLFTVYAGLGKGKSAYAIFCLVMALKNYFHCSDAEAWEKVKGFIVFHPQQFFDKLDQIRDIGMKRAPAIIWDDAGLWLYALDWNDPFIKALGKYMNVARSRLGALIMTTPTPKMIFSKVRDMPDAINVKIIKTTGAPRAEWVRRAKGYQQSMLPDMKKSRVHLRYTDDFVCRMPDEFYNWYKPLRDEYEQLALDLIKESWAKSKEKHQGSIPELSNYPKLAIPDMEIPKRVV